MQRRNNVVITSPLIGDVIVPNIDVGYCAVCDDSLIPYEAWGIIDEYVSKLEDAAIKQLPIGDFVPVMQAITMLEVTKQAFSKNKRIQRGFIISIKKGNRRFYYVPSIKAYKEFGDGRIQVTQHHQTTTRTIVFAKFEGPFTEFTLDLRPEDDDSSATIEKQFWENDYYKDRDNYVH